MANPAKAAAARKTRARTLLNRVSTTAGRMIGAAAISAGEGRKKADKARFQVLIVMRAWSNLPEPMRKDPEVLMESISESFVTMKSAGKDGAEAEWERKKAAFDADPEQLDPNTYMSVGDARRNGGKGIRNRRRAFSQFAELLHTQPELAIASISPESTLNWTQKEDVWKGPTRDRVSNSRLKIAVGIDEYGGIHMLGEKYKEAYVVTTDAEGVEHTNVTVGAKGATQDIPVTIKQESVGTVYDTAVAGEKLARRMARNWRKTITDLEDAQTLEEFEISTGAPEPANS